MPIEPSRCRIRGYYGFCFTVFYEGGYHCLAKHGDGLSFKVMVCEDQRFLGLLLLEIKRQREVVEENNRAIGHVQEWKIQDILE